MAVHILFDPFITSNYFFNFTFYLYYYIYDIYLYYYILITSVNLSVGMCRYVKKWVSYL